jgi:hypothetical protein
MLPILQGVAKQIGSFASLFCLPKRKLTPGLSEFIKLDEPAG